ncbi:hypothetical protein NEOCIP111885_01482 [Pseudoneobacillus rhizosphaerae]|uniref:histidine kinase n=1 Tax=Pseudoneobacillus rhizosphaerae TaxID=2880968 RepID=A0A9C7G971_9BACI|nr:hypothetical protein NEOCIP111885_01482 [Pseudoneobacillus rhizosphaerae]
MFSREIEIHTPSTNCVQILAAGIAHEVRNPFTAVKGFLKLLNEEINHRYILTMEQELDKALSTLTNLLNVTKSDFHDEPSVPINLCQEIDSISYLFNEWRLQPENHRYWKRHTRRKPNDARYPLLYNEKQWNWYGSYPSIHDYPSP